MLDIIKEYLVSLGFKVDAPSYNQTMQTMQNSQRAVEKFAKTSVAQFAAAGAAVTAFVVAANAGIAKFITGLAQADLEAEKLSRRMWTSKENAMAYSNILKSMGVTLEDLYLSPELQRNFFELRGQINQMAAPTEFAKQMKYVRSIVFEFQRLKLEATYALQWVGYYFIKYMSGPLGDVKKFLQDINKAIVREMPHWTKTIAQVMSWFARMGIALVRGGKDILDIFKRASDAIPGNIKVIAVALGALGLALQTGPIGAFVIAFSALLLLLDDYYTYKDGGKSLFEGLWESLNKFKTEMGSSKELREFIDKLKESVQNLSTWLGNLRLELQKTGIDKDLVTDTSGLASAFGNLALQVSNLLTELTGLMNTDVGKFFNNVILKNLKMIDEKLQSITGVIKSVTKLLKGDVIGFLKEGVGSSAGYAKTIVSSKTWGMSDYALDILGQLTKSKDNINARYATPYATPAPMPTAPPTPTPTTQLDLSVRTEPKIEIHIDQQGTILSTRITQEEAQRMFRNLQGVQR